MNFSIKEEYYNIPTKVEIDNNESSSDDEILDIKNDVIEINDKHKEVRKNINRHLTEYEIYKVPDMSNLNVLEKRVALFKYVSSLLDDQLQTNQRMLEKLRNQEFYDKLFNF